MEIRAIAAMIKAAFLLNVVTNLGLRDRNRHFWTFFMTDSGLLLFCGTLHLTLPSISKSSTQLEILHTLDVFGAAI